MAAFNYTAVDQKGKHHKGVLEGDSARQVRVQLRGRGWVPLSVEEVKQAHRAQAKQTTSFSLKKARGWWYRKLSAEDLALLTRQMATLLSAGVPLDEVLSSVADQAEKNHMKSVILGVRAKVMEGFTLAEAMADFPSAFPLLYRTTVASGESSGKLDRVLTKLADYTEKQYHIQSKIRQALIYPALMTIVSLAVIVFLLIYVVPKIVTVFSQTGQTLPLATTILIAISNFISHYGIILLIVLIVLGWLVKRFLKKPHIRYRWHQFLLRLPFFGHMIKTINTARFARTFGILSAASVPVLEAMQTASRLIISMPMHRRVMVAIDQVREGTSIHQALQKTRCFSPMFISLVASGENSGRLEEMLEKAANQQEYEIERYIEGGLTLFEPLMILVMGAIVLFIVLAIMLPIFAMDQYSG